MNSYDALAKPLLVNVPKEFAMTRLIQANPFALGRMPSQTVVSSNTDNDSRPLAGMLLAAVMAALLVAADQVIDSWADGHLLAAWVALWTICFAALAVLATPLRKASNAGANWFVTWRKACAAQRAEEDMWEMARQDPRVMMEIRLASLRQIQGL